MLPPNCCWTIEPVKEPLDVQAARGFVDTLESVETQSRAEMEASVDVVFRSAFVMLPAV